MKNERGGGNLGREPKPREKREPSYVDLIKKQTEDDVKRILPILEKDSNWELGSGKKDWHISEYKKQRLAVSKLTRKAVHLLFPEYKAEVHRGRGSASGWMNVNFKLPWEGKNIDEWRGIISRTRALLLKLGIEYEQYYTDHGPNNHYSPCLSVTVNHTS